MLDIISRIRNLPFPPLPFMRQQPEWIYITSPFPDQDMKTMHREMANYSSSPSSHEKFFVDRLKRNGFVVGFTSTVTRKQLTREEYYALFKPVGINDADWSYTQKDLEALVREFLDWKLINAVWNFYDVDGVLWIATEYPDNDNIRPHTAYQNLKSRVILKATISFDVGSALGNVVFTD